MASDLLVRDWVTMVKGSDTTPKRANLIGVSVTLAARLLGVSRSRVDLVPVAALK